MSIDKRQKLFLEISKKENIRSIKPEYRIILDILQTISPTTRQELLEEINNTYDFEIFTYNQLYPHLMFLIELGAIKNNDETKQISINSDYISNKTLLISKYSIGVFAISAIFLIISLIKNFKVDASVSAFLVGIIYLLIQQYDNKFISKH